MAMWNVAMDVVRWASICMADVGAWTGRTSLHERRSDARRDRGQSMIEYTLIFFLVVLGLILVLVFMGPQIANEYRTISNNL